MKQTFRTLCAAILMLSAMPLWAQWGRGPADPHPELGMKDAYKDYFLIRKHPLFW